MQTGEHSIPNAQPLSESSPVRISLVLSKFCIWSPN